MPLHPGSAGEPPSPGAAVGLLPVLALVAALLAIVLPPLALVAVALGVVALARGGGRGLAAAAVAVGGTVTVLTATVVVMTLTAPFSPVQGSAWFRVGAAPAPAAQSSPDATGATSPPPATSSPTPSSSSPPPAPAPSPPTDDPERRTAVVGGLVVGDCVEELFDEEEAVETVVVISCDLPHAYEVFGVYDVEDALWPGDDGIADIAIGGCGTRFDEAVAARGLDASALDVWVLFPTKESWDWGDRSVTCMVYDWQDGVLYPGRLLTEVPAR